MSYFPCSNCGQRVVGKLASIYANWFEGEEREAWRTRLCASCLTDLMGSLKAGESADSSMLTVCPMCGKDSSQNLSGVYLTIYPPKQPEREYALTTCGSCAITLRQLFTRAGDKLPNRNAGAAAPAQPQHSEWSSIPW